MQEGGSMECENCVWARLDTGVPYCPLPFCFYSRTDIEEMKRRQAAKQTKSGGDDAEINRAPKTLLR